MKAFVTGATGLVGTHIVHQLEREGWDIVALHRASSDISELKKCRRVRCAVGDVTDPDSLRRAMPEGVDAVFHAAGSVGNLPRSREGLRYEINQAGTRNVVTVCREKKAGRLLYTSTILSYDFRDGRRVTEDAAPNDWCRDPYIHSKRLGDVEVEKGIEAGLDAVFLHPTVIFGAYDKEAWSKMFLEIQRGLPLPFAPPGGASVCHAAKVGEGHVAAFHRGGRGRHYILSGPDATWLHVAQTIGRILRRPGPKMRLPTPLFKAYGRTEYLVSSLLKREPMLSPHSIYLLSISVYSDSSRAERDLGYRSSSLETMLRDCHQWMVATGRLPALSETGTAAGMEAETTVS